MRRPLAASALDVPPDKSVAALGRQQGEHAAAPKGLLGITSCRRILGPDCALSDEEIETLRDQLTILADVAIDGFLDAKDES